MLRPSAAQAKSEPKIVLFDRFRAPLVITRLSMPRYADLDGPQAKKRAQNRSIRLILDSTCYYEGSHQMLLLSGKSLLALALHQEKIGAQNHSNRLILDSICTNEANHEMLLPS